jgi:hypothetical protein
MAKVKKVGKRHCVTHDTTGAVLKRKGHRVCFTTRGKAAADARATRRRVMG